MDLRRSSLVALEKLLQNIFKNDMNPPLTSKISYSKGKGTPEFLDIMAVAGQAATCHFSMDGDVSAGKSGDNTTSVSDICLELVPPSTSPRPAPVVLSDQSLILSLAGVVQILFKLQDKLRSTSSNPIDGLNTNMQKLKNTVVDELLLVSGNNSSLTVDDYKRLQGTITQVQQSSGGSLVTDEASKELWVELETLMLTVSSICSYRASSPAPAPINEILRSKSSVDFSLFVKPGFPSIGRKSDVSFSTSSTSSFGPTIPAELKLVVIAIERVFKSTPPYFNQIVFRTRDEENLISAAVLGSIVERLSRGRLENQRAAMDSISSIIEKIVAAGRHSLENQRTGFSERSVKLVELGKLGEKIADVRNRTRMENQVCKDSFLM